MQFILGGPGTGKTTRCLQEINQRLDDGDKNIPLYYLVPEQFSLQSERLLLSSRSAATQVQVLSFNRLAYRLFAILGEPLGKLADDLGKQMLLRKVLFEAADDLTYYKSAANKLGFVDTLAHTITEMNQYRISAADLRNRAQDSPPALAAKLHDMALLLEKYRETVTDRYLLTDDMLELLCQRLTKDNTLPNPLLDGAFFWVDGFSGFTPQERQVLLHIAQRTASLVITLTTRDRENYTDPLCTPPRETMEKLTQLAKNKGIVVHPNIYLAQNHRHHNSPELAFFAQNFSVYGSHAIYQKPADNIEIIAAADRYASVYSAADYILRRVREGYRFRDIAILCGDRSQYEKILTTVFDRLNIPLFVDTQTDILSHPITELIRAFLDISVRNYSYESVFCFLKTRLTGMESYMIDVLENYVLEHGISSYRWRYPFANAIAEAGRVQLLQAMESANNRTDTVQNHCRRVFDMLYALKVPQTLQTWFDAHMKAGDPDTARLHKQIWPKCCEIFDKLADILGNEKVTVKTFAQILDAGFAQVGLGHIPPRADQVILGDMGRSRYPEIRAMIVLGANDNALPPLPTQSGLLTDRERKTLRDTNHAGIELAPENYRRINEGYYSLYNALCQPSEKLIFIYATAEPGNTKPLRPAPILKRVRELFPQICVQNAPQFQEYGAKHKLPDIPAILSPESAGRLYGDVLITAASRLESFARCPFAYFMHYVLEARERKRFQVLPVDLGNLFHDVIAGFSRQIWENGDGKDISRDQISHIVDELVNRLTLDDNLYHSTARNRHILNKVRRTAVQSIWALCEHLRRGSFVPTLTEHEIRTGQGILLASGQRIVLTGRVDRVDVLDTADGSKYLKIIDYKSGSTKFSLDEVRAGVQLQLMLYMNVLTQTMPGAKPGGVFYFPIGDPLLNTDATLDDTAREEGLLKQFKMSGITVSDEPAIQGLDTNLSPGAESSIVPVGLNKDGRFKKTAHPMDMDDVQRLSRDVDDAIKELGQRMVCGDIEARPYTKGLKCPCQFCGFSGVCGESG